MTEKAKTRILGNQRHKLHIFRIESRYEDGTPEVVRLIKDTQTCELSTDITMNNFFTAYVPDIDYKEHAGEIPTV